MLMFEYIHTALSYMHVGENHEMFINVYTFACYFCYRLFHIWTLARCSYLHLLHVSHFKWTLSYLILSYLILYYPMLSYLSKAPPRFLPNFFVNAPDWWLSTQRISAHYNDVIMSMMASQITRLTIVYSTVYSGADQRKHQSSALLAFVWGIHRWPVNSPYKGTVTVTVTWRHHDWDYYSSLRSWLLWDIWTFSRDPRTIFIVNFFSPKNTYLTNAFITIKIKRSWRVLKCLRMKLYFH